MNHEDLETLLHKRPFQPFRIHLTDGAAYDVRHPDQCIVSRRMAAIGVKADPSLSVNERLELVALLHINRIESLEPTSV